MSPAQVESLAERSFAAAEWSNIFDDISAGAPPEWFPQPYAAAQSQSTSDGATFQQLSILSPTAGPTKLFDFQPALSFDSADSSISNVASDPAARNVWRSQVAPPELLMHIDQVALGLKKVKQAWSKPFRDIEAGYKLVIADLCVMHSNVQNMHTRLGDPLMPTPQGKTVWEALSALQDAQHDLEHSTSELEERLQLSMHTQLSALGIPQNLAALLADLRTSHQQQDLRLTQIENMLRVHSDRFNHIRPILAHLSTLPQPGGVTGSSSSQRVENIEARLTQLEKQPSGVNIHDAGRNSATQTANCWLGSVHWWPNLPIL